MGWTHTEHPRADVRKTVSAGSITGVLRVARDAIELIPRTADRYRMLKIYPSNIPIQFI